MAIFNKTKSNKKIQKTDLKKDQNVEAGSNENISRKISTEALDAYKVIKNIYVSEKASMLLAFNQYVFKVFTDTNKNEIRKNVEKLFSVKVKDVKVLNMPEKRRDTGRHPGFKSGYKKAIVTLEKGHTIEQAG